MLIGFVLAAVLPFTTAMEHQVDDLARHVVTAKRAPGCAIGIVEDGRIVYAQGFGFADPSRKLRYSPQTQTPIGAISTQFTAGAMLLLEQSGKLKLDDPVTKYVPELTVAKGVTIRDLLQHTSGLPDPTIGGDHLHTVKLDDLIAQADKLPLVSTPGTTYAENPFNYMIAGRIIERASGVPLSDYLQQHIFLPLLMDSTLLAGDTGISRDHATSPVPMWDPAWLYGGRGVITNIYDLAKWDIGLPLLLRVDAEREMFTASTASGPEHAALGWVADERAGKPYYWQNEALPGFRAINALDLEDHVAVIMFANGEHAPVERYAAQIFDIILPPARISVDNAIVARAKEWLNRLASGNIDRTQLTPAFSAYLNDRLIAHSGLAQLGKPVAFVPIASTATKDGGTLYEFLVRFPHEQYRYRFGVTKDGKINELYLER
jgi:D-alanyl-D-alanine carboxypeptidase